MIKYDRFYRTYGIRRLAELNRIADISSIEEMPIGSILHVLDNFKFNQNLFISPDANNPIYKIKPDKKFIYNVHADSSLSPELTKGIKPIQSGVLGALTKFKQQNIKTVRFNDNMNNIKVNPAIHNVFNYNLLSNTITTGPLKQFRMTNYILMNVINILNKLPDYDHFVNIPAENMILKRNDFIRAFAKIDRTTLRYTESSYYLVVLYLLCEIKRNEKLSIFSHLNKNVLNKINFIISTDTQCLIFNLATLLKISEKNNIELKFLNGLNQMVSSGKTTEGITEQVPATIVTINTKLESNSPAFRENLTVEELTSNFQENIEEIDDVSKNIINEDESLSDAQKKSLTDISNEYKNLKIGEEKLIDIINNDVDQEVNENELSFLEKDDEIVDKSMLKSNVTTLGDVYMKKLFKKDMVTTLLSFNKQGLFLTNIEEENVDNYMNSMTYYKITFKDTNFKTHTIKFSIPKIDKKGLCLINGSPKKLKIQRVNNPIVKVSPVRVTLNSNYNKCLVERNTNVANSFYSYFLRILDKTTVNKFIYYENQTINDLQYHKIKVDANLSQKYEDGEFFKHTLTEDIDITIGDYLFTNIGPVCVLEKEGNELLLVKSFNPNILPYEFSVIGEKIYELRLNGLFWRFNFKKRFENVRSPLSKLIPKYLQYEKDYGVYLGFNPGAMSEAYYLNLKGVLTKYDTITNKVLYKTTLIDEILDYAEVKMNPLNEYCNVKILNRKIPIALMLCYRFGLTHMLNYLNVDYNIYVKGTKLPETCKTSDVKIKFADKVLVIKRAPMLHSLIFAGLNYFDYSEINLEEMETQDVYYDLLNNKKIAVNLLKGIDSFFDLFMDPMTRDVLFQMREPTNFKDLLIRAVVLLTTADHNETSSSKNFRFRTYETFTSTVYRELSLAFAAYKYKTFGSTDRFSIKDDAINKKIMQSQLFNNIDTLNPIHDIKQKCAFTHVGDGGRSSESFVTDDRKFPKDGTGIISEATVDSGGVAMNAMLTMNPNIVNARGMTISKNVEDIKPSEMLSLTSLLMPCATNDDKIVC